jgi:hypothetical protein
MKRRTTFALTVMALIGLAMAMPTGDALAQQKQRVSFKTPPENSKYTQQHVIEVGDTPGHEVRVYEIHRDYPSNAPVVNGLKIAESWTRGVSDYIDGNGSNTSYSVYVLENGDKLFTRVALVAQSLGSGKLTTTAAGPIIGGTGKLAGIQGTVRTLGTAEPKAGVNENQTDIEYSMAR